MGFTLIEVIVGAALAAFVGLMSFGILASVIDAFSAAERTGHGAMTMANARTWISEALEGVDIAPERPFVGTTSSAEFHAWMWSHEGWPELRRVRLATGDEGLAMDAGLGAPITLPDSAGSPQLEWLVRMPDGTAWLDSWSSQIAAPLALRLRSARGESNDLTFLVGDHR